jgi:hypothetical protein
MFARGYPIRVKVTIPAGFTDRALNRSIAGRKLVKPVQPMDAWSRTWSPS